MNNLNQFLLFLRIFFLFVIKIYLKFHIRLSDLITENTFGYLVYLFVTIYAFYGGKSNGCYKISHFIAFCCILYLGITILQIFILCEIKCTRKFLDNLLTEKYTIKYLGPDSKSDFSVRFFILILVIFTLEILTKQYNFIQDAIALTDIYYGAYGTDDLNWAEEVKQAYRNEMDKVILHNKHGFVTFILNTYIMDTEQIKTLVGVLFSNLNDAAKILFNKTKNAIKSLFKK